MNRVCLCGKEMTLFMEDDRTWLWVCPPSGCGRLLLESKGGDEIAGTWYQPEENLGAREID